ncbi:MAG: M56 family metallopeptidase [Chitinophagaceae bacterium]
MGILAAYLIKAIVASGLLYGYYLLALRNKKFHAYNRFYLLAAVILSLIIPFAGFGWLSVDAPQHSGLGGVVNSIQSPATNQLFTVSNLLAGAGILVSLFLLFLLLGRIGWIYKIRHNNPRTKMKEFTLVETDLPQAPFSFFTNLFWKQGLSATDIHGARIFSHELAHIRQRHSYDKLFGQLVCCLCWINPFYWLMQKELATIHEFLADAEAVEEGDTEAFAAMLLRTHNDGRYLSPSHPFFNSSIKRRLFMISQSNKTSSSYWRRVVALPVALGVLALLSVTLKANTATEAPVKLLLQPAADTVPKAAATPPAAPAKQPETITVTGYKRDNATGPVSVNVQARPKASPQEVVVIGRKADDKITPVTVEGHQLEKPSPEPVTVVGHRTGTQVPEAITEVKVEAKPAPKTITVVGHKIEPKPTTKVIPVTPVTGQPIGAQAPAAGDKTEKKP